MMPCVKGNLRRVIQFCLCLMLLCLIGPDQHVRAKENIRLFGTVEFGRPSRSLPMWEDMLRRNDGKSIFTPGKYLDRRTSWDALKNRADGMTDVEKLRLVNSFWNKWPYVDDVRNWKQKDYWAAPFQFLKKSGDCEDYAIAKYFTLKEMGIETGNMRIVILRDTIRNLSHAVLAVYLNGNAYILDNLSNVVMSHTKLGHYAPQVSINEHGCWAHVKPKKQRNTKK